MSTYKTCVVDSCMFEAKYSNPLIVTLPGPQPLVFCNFHFMEAMKKVSKRIRYVGSDFVTGAQLKEQILREWCPGSAEYKEEDKR